MKLIHRISLLFGLSLSLMALSAQAQHDPTINIIPDPAAEHLAIPELANGEGVDNGTAGREDGLETAQGNLADAKAMAEEARANAEEHAANATEAAAEALANAPTPDELPAVPEGTAPEENLPTELPTPPAGEPGV